MSRSQVLPEIRPLKGRALKLDLERREKFKFRRHVSVSVAYAVQLDQDGNRLCSRCLAPIGGRRRRWCSEGCVTDAMVRCNSQVDIFVFRRDRGVCAVCKVDVESLRKTFHRVIRSIKNPLDRGNVERNEIAKRLIDLGFSRISLKRWWEVDHVVPVIEGGGFCGLDGLRTLCLVCHRKATAELAARRAAQRRMAQTEEIWAGSP